MYQQSMIGNGNSDAYPMAQSKAALRNDSPCRISAHSQLPYFDDSVSLGTMTTSIASQS